MTDETEKTNFVERGTLYVVATPIGNLSDMTGRAKQVLSEVDFVAAEDTRVSGKLLNLYGISGSMVNYFEHNKREMGEKILMRLRNGESCALVTDAGTPAISDPGEDLCALCHENGVKVVPIPGCCAAIAALSASGMPSRRFSFEGFLPREKKEMAEVLEDCKTEKRTLIFYEAPHRLSKTLAALYDALGDRELCLCRELTKRNEEILRTTLKGAIALYETTEPRGEYVLIVAGCPEKSGDAAFWENLSIEEHVGFYEAQGMKRMDAIKAAAKDRGVSKNEIYKEMLPK